MILYPATYIDQSGAEESAFESDGESLTIRLRNQTFVSNNFDSLEATGPAEKADFHFDDHGYLTDCRFKIIFPIKIRRHATDKNAALLVEIVLEHSKAAIATVFELTMGAHTFKIPGWYPRAVLFEAHLPQLRSLLPSDFKIHACLYCAYSNYWVSGSDTFGTLGCYKDLKDKIIDVKDKSEYMDVATGAGTATQETYWCPEFMEIAEHQWQYKDSL